MLQNKSMLEKFFDTLRGLSKGINPVWYGTEGNITLATGTCFGNCFIFGLPHNFSR